MRQRNIVILVDSLIRADRQEHEVCHLVGHPLAQGLTQQRDRRHQHQGALGRELLADEQRAQRLAGARCRDQLAAVMFLELADHVGDRLYLVRQR